MCLKLTEAHLQLLQDCRLAWTRHNSPETWKVDFLKRPNQLLVPNERCTSKSSGRAAFSCPKLPIDNEETELPSQKVFVMNKSLSRVFPIVSPFRAGTAERLFFNFGSEPFKFSVDDLPPLEVWKTQRRWAYGSRAGLLGFALSETSNADIS